MEWTERFEVARNYDGWRLDRYLTDQLSRATRSKVTRIIKASTRFADGRKVKPGSIIRAGDVVLIDRTERIDPATPELGEIRVLKEQDGLVALDKPAGMLVHRTAHEVSRTVDAFLAQRFPGELVSPLHRLDRDTSGVLLCGRGAAVIREAAGLFEASIPTKTYLARVADAGSRWGVGERASLDAPLGFDSSSAVELRMGQGELVCATHVEVLSRSGDTALLSLQIERGRQHQIRAHLSLAGTPVVGDKLYQMGDEFFLDWLAQPGDLALAARLDTRWHCLHAWRLELPWRGADLSFESAEPHWVT